MKPILAIALVLAIAVPAVAARRRAVVAPADGLTITFDATQVDVGTLVHDFAKHTTSVTRTIVLRVDRTGSANRGLVLLKASRETDDARFILRVDGVVLHGEVMPVATIPLGVNTSHRIEIIVPADADEGELMTNIHWEVTTP